MAKSLLNEIFEDDLEQTTVPNKGKSLLNEIFEDSPKEDSSTIAYNNNVLDANTVTYKSLYNDKNLIDSAKRFARDRNKIKQELTDKEAIDNFISHFRSFQVNELTAGADWNYISGVSTDSKKVDKVKTTKNELSRIAQQKFQDYGYLYNKFHQLPNFYEDGGAKGALLDYVYGIITAPSTLVGLIPMFGQVAKGASLAATTATKLAVSNAIKAGAKNSFTPLTTLASTIGKNPIKSSMLLEGAAGGLQDISRQNVEMEIGVKDKYSPLETGIGVGAGMAAPAFLGIVGAKTVAAKAISQAGQGKQLTPSLIKEIDKSIIAKNVEANKIAETTLKDKLQVGSKLKEVLPALNPEQVLKGTQVGKSMLDAQIVDDVILSIDPSRTKRILAAVAELISTNKNIEKSFLRNARDADGNWKIRPTQAISNLLKSKKIGKKTREEFLSDIYEKYNITGDDMANLFLATFSNAGKTLQQAGQFKQLFNSVSDDTYDLLGMDVEFKEVFKKAKGLGEKANVREFLKVTEGEGPGLGRSLDELRLAAMTSQVGTTVRNTASGYTRIGLDTAVNLVDRGIASAVKTVSLGKYGKGTVGLFDAKPNDDIFALVFGLTNKVETEAIDSMFKLNFNKQASSLYRELRDIDFATTGKSPRLTKARAIGKQLNALNTLSDNYFKRVAFIGSLKKRLNQNYARTMDEIKTGLTGKLDKTKLKKAIDATTMSSSLKTAIKRAAEATPTKQATVAGQLEKAAQFSKQIQGTNINDIEKIVQKEYDVIDMLKGNRFATYLKGKEGQKLIDDVVKDSLYFTYQKSPEAALGKALIQAVHRAPFITSSVIPFPRFIINAMRFTYEYSPAYLLSPLNNAFRKSFAKDSENYTEVAKGLVGTGALLGAAAYRYHSLDGKELGGEKWYEGRLPNGNTFDLRPFFPAAPYLFFGDLLARSYKNLKEGKDLAITPGTGTLTKESLQALSGTQFRAGFGLWLIDDAMEDALRGTQDDDVSGIQNALAAAGPLFSQFAGNLVSTYTIPLTPIKDVYDTWIASDDARIANTTKSSDLFSLFLNKSLSRIPENYRLEKLISETTGFTLPSESYEPATRGEPVRRITPITRQTYGILQSDKKNFLEKEFETLKLNRNFLRKPSGVPEADRLINNLIGEWSSTFLSPLLEQSEIYNNLKKQEEKKNFIRAQRDNWLDKIISLAEIIQKREEVYDQSTGLTLDKKYGFNPIKKMKVEGKFRGDRKIHLEDAKALYNKKYGKPKRDAYDYDLLETFATKFLENFEARISPQEYYN